MISTCALGELQALAAVQVCGSAHAVVSDRSMRISDGLDPRQARFSDPDQRHAHAACVDAAVLLKHRRNTCRLLAYRNFIVTFQTR